MDKYTTLLGRLLVAQIFIIAGVGKIGGYAATAGWMESMGVPGMLLPGCWRGSALLVRPSSTTTSLTRCSRLCS